jgi:hypothetical protein
VPEFEGANEYLSGGNQGQHGLMPVMALVIVGQDSHGGEGACPTEDCRRCA